MRTEGNTVKNQGNHGIHITCADKISVHGNTVTNTPPPAPANIFKRLLNYLRAEWPIVSKSTVKRIPWIGIAQVVLTCALLVGVYLETGFWTVLILALVALRFELEAL